MQNTFLLNLNTKTNYLYKTTGDDNSQSKINNTRVNSINAYEECSCLCYNYLSLFKIKQPSLNNFGSRLEQLNVST